MNCSNINKNCISYYNGECIEVLEECPFKDIEKIESDFMEFWKDNYIRISEMPIKKQFLELFKAGIAYENNRFKE